MEEEKNTNPWEFFTGGDDEETIQNCLNCSSPYCNNCVEYIKKKGKAPSVRRFAPEEVEILKDLSLSNSDIAELLNRDLRQIQEKRYRLGIIIQKRSCRNGKYSWNKEIDAYLMSHMPKEVEAKYGIPAKAAAMRRYYLGKRKAVKDEMQTI